MKGTKARGQSMTEGVIYKQLLAFFFPILLGTLFQQLYNTVDAIVVGRFVGKEALAAVGGSAAQISNLIIGFFVGLSSGTAVIISQYFGAHDDDGVSRATHTAICLAVCAGLLMTALGILTAPGLLRLMHTPKEILPGSTQYLRILFLAMVPSMVYNVGSGVLRAVGDSRRPLYFLIFACLVNVALDILFVIAFHMSVAGVAIATALAQLAAAALIVVSLGRVDGAHRLRRSALRIDRDILLRTLRIGLPSGLQAVLYSLSNMVITTTINGFGTATVAAWVSLGKIDGLFWMINNAFGVSIMTFAGQNYGARKFDRIRKGLLTCGAMALAAAMLFGAVFFIFAVALFSLFTQDGEVLQIALEMMRHIAPWYWLFVPIEMISGSLRGMGNTLIPTLITAVGICLFRVFWMFAVVPNWLEIRAITISYPISWLLTGAVFIAYYLWMRKRLFEHNSL